MNVLHYGDNLDILREMPSASVDLIYLDPPFNSNRAYNMIFRTPAGEPASAQIKAFDDTWTWSQDVAASYQDMIEGGAPDRIATVLKALRQIIPDRGAPLMAYIVMMAPRLIELHNVLKPTGSLYLHCDPTASHYLKLLLDAVFGGENFRNEIIWRRTRAHNDKSITRYGAIHDVILFYSKSGNWLFNPQYSEREESAPKTHDLYVHTDGKVYRKGDCLAPGGRGPRYEWNGHTRNWRFTPEERDRLIGEGSIVYSKNGMPRILRPVDPDKGSPLQDLWTDIDPPNSGSAEKLDYPTQKPVALLERIIAGSSREGDVVLDPFCGCGTTIDAAERLGRKWIGIDITYIAIHQIQKRLHDAYGDRLAKLDVRGIPRDIEGAQSLFKKNPFDFERWAVSLVNGQPNAKQTGDRGIDGVIRFPDSKQIVGRALVSVKGGRQLSPGMVRDLIGTVESEQAAMGILILLEPPTAGMTTAAGKAGLYEVKILGRRFPKIQIFTIEELLSGKRPDMPMPFAPYVRAKGHSGSQLALFRGSASKAGTDPE